ncbi:FAD-binding protein [Leptolyngbya sp. GGD]|uniref:FAD-binding protein n=1 Tax=Leptolyngbya sp. GGD TaxID=2997907 RepID=UPI00227B5BD7|nr:FAD-binding protein [Leptolyngbya sp. GGD]MCY6494211.1 FAD-binding protein [Leptolyngbya sp. GGD]
MSDILDSLRQGIQGEVTDIVPAQYQTDFGGLRRKQPGILVTAHQEKDILHALEVAQTTGTSLTVRGAGHSCNGQSLNSGGILLENFSRSAEVEFLEDGLVEVSGRSCWRAVEECLNQAGRQSAVLTDYLDLSVGGTLSVGGMGLNSIAHGFQVDQVRRLRLIQPNGQVLWCSPHENETLFRFALAGLGQVGIIDKVVMQTQPFSKFTHTVKRQHDSVSEMLEFLPELAAPNSGIQHFNGYISLNEIASEYGYMSQQEQFSDACIAPALYQDSDQVKTEQDFPFQLQARRDVWLSAFPDHFQIWTDYIFDYANVVRFMEFLEPLMREQPLSEALKAIYILMIRRPVDHTNFAFLPAPKGTLLFSVGLYTMVSRWNPMLLTKTLPVLQMALQQCCALGGRPYLYGCNEMDERQKQAFYGADYLTLHELRRQHGLSNLNRESF